MDGVSSIPGGITNVSNASTPLILPSTGITPGMVNQNATQLVTASYPQASTNAVIMATANKTMSPAPGTNATQTIASPAKPSAQPTASLPSATSSPITLSQGTPSHRPTHSDTAKVLDKRRIQELVKEVDPLEQLDDEVEDMLMQIADDFIDNVVNASCQLAKHRRSNTVEVKDVQLHLERCWNIMIPGFGSEDLRPYRKSATTEAHKQRLALIKKTLKKY